MRNAWLAVLAGLILAGCSLQQGVADRGDAAGSNPSTAPPLSGTALSGEKVDLAGDRGHPVVIDFWASWCGPCIAEQSSLNTLAQQYGARGVHFIGVDMLDGAAQARAFEQQYAVPYPSLDDHDESIAAAWNVTAPPTVVVVDAQGRAVQRYLGTVAGMAQLLDQLLGH